MHTPDDGNTHYMDDKRCISPSASNGRLGYEGKRGHRPKASANMRRDRVRLGLELELKSGFRSIVSILRPDCGRKTRRRESHEG
jgi:hypothetical protein